MLTIDKETGDIRWTGGDRTATVWDIIEFLAKWDQENQDRPHQQMFMFPTSRILILFPPYNIDKGTAKHVTGGTIRQGSDGVDETTFLPGGTDV